jgi:hypothetical protein
MSYQLISLDILKNCHVANLSREIAALCRKYGDSRLDPRIGVLFRRAEQSAGHIPALGFWAGLAFSRVLSLVTEAVSDDIVGL